MWAWADELPLERCGNGKANSKWKNLLLAHSKMNEIPTSKFFPLLKILEAFFFQLLFPESATSNNQTPITLSIRSCWTILSKPSRDISDLMMGAEQDGDILSLIQCPVVISHRELVTNEAGPLIISYEIDKIRKIR